MAGSGFLNEQDIINNDPRRNPKSSISPSFGDPATFGSAVNTQAGDYDSIMAQYKNLAAQGSQNPITASTVSTPSVAPQTAPYVQSADVTKSLSNLSSLSDTGGYTDAGIADIRARDISPIRSIYSNAQQNVERAKALGGGYSPNFNATQAKMARDESDKIGDVTTAANAGIAQNVAANKLSASSSYAGASSTANAATAAADKANADIVNQINESNAARATSVATGNADRTLAADSSNRDNILKGIQGQASLYGTTPALVNTFGNQVGDAARLGQGQQDINEQRHRNTLDFARSA